MGGGWGGAGDLLPLTDREWLALYYAPWENYYISPRGFICNMRNKEWVARRKREAKQQEKDMSDPKITPAKGDYLIVGNNIRRTHFDYACDAADYAKKCINDGGGNSMLVVQVVATVDKNEQRRPQFTETGAFVDTKNGPVFINNEILTALGVRH
jgi:hypothetical protein